MIVNVDGYAFDIDKNKITSSAVVSVIWNDWGIAVDLNYSYSNEDGYGEGVLCFYEPYNHGLPDEVAWEEALSIGVALKNKYNLPIHITKESITTKGEPK